MLTVLAAVAIASAAEELTVGSHVIGIEFITPRTVHITKVPAGRSLSRPSLVVTARPQEGLQLKRQSSATALTVSSAELSVSLDRRTGLVTFAGRGGMKLAERDFSFEERTTGPDRGASRVTTSWTVGKDEPVYGLGTRQDGLLSHRGKHFVMEQTNLEDYQNVLQSIRGWGKNGLMPVVRIFFHRAFPVLSGFSPANTI